MINLFKFNLMWFVKKSIKFILSLRNINIICNLNLVKNLKNFSPFKFRENFHNFVDNYRRITQFFLKCVENSIKLISWLVNLLQILKILSKRTNLNKILLNLTKMLTNAIKFFLKFISCLKNCPQFHEVPFNYVNLKQVFLKYTNICLQLNFFFTNIFEKSI